MVQLLCDSELNADQRGNVQTAMENLECLTGHINNLMVYKWLFYGRGRVIFTECFVTPNDFLQPGFSNIVGYN